MWTIKSYEGDLEACDCFGTPLTIGADVIYTNIDCKRPKIRTGVILDIDPKQGVQLSYNRWESRIKLDSRGKKPYLEELKPEDWERVEIESKVWLKAFEKDPVEPGKAIFENIYQTN